MSIISMTFLRYVCLTHGKSYSFELKLPREWLLSSRVIKNVYKICKLRRAIFSALYNISPPNFAKLLNSGRSF